MDANEIAYWNQRYDEEAASKYACQAIYRYENRRTPPKFLQVVVSDRDGILPWQRGDHAAFMRSYQPLLWQK